jgi:Tol biopolymer transport system component
LLGKIDRPASVDSFDYPSGWTHDAKWLFITSNRTGGRNQVYRQAVGQESAEMLTSGTGDNGSAEMTPDQKWILYWKSSRATSNGALASQTLMRMPAGGGNPQGVLDAPANASSGFHCAMRQAQRCVASLGEKDEVVFYDLDPMKGRGSEIARTKTGAPGIWMTWAIAPDGSRIAITGSQDLDRKVRVLDLRTKVERDLGLPPLVRLVGVCWSADGRRLYGTGQTSEFLLLRLELDGKAEILLNRARTHFLFSPSPSPDGKSLAFSQQSTESNVYLIENF